MLMLALLQFVYHIQKTYAFTDLMVYFTCLYMIQVTNVYRPITQSILSGSGANYYRYSIYYTGL